MNKRNVEHIDNYTLDFTGKKVIIKDINSGETIIESIIKEHDKGRQLISVQTLGTIISPDIQNTSIIIFTKDGILNYLGTRRKTLKMNTLELALYKGSIISERKHERFSLDAKGIINCVIISNQNINLRKPLEIDVRNISASGILIEGLSDSFCVGNIFKLKIDSRKFDLLLTCLIVRISEVDILTTQYGCRFIESNNIIGDDS